MFHLGLVTPPTCLPIVLVFACVSLFVVADSDLVTACVATCLPIFSALVSSRVSLAIFKILRHLCLWFARETKTTTHHFAGPPKETRRVWICDLDPIRGKEQWLEALPQDELTGPPGHEPSDPPNWISVPPRFFSKVSPSRVLSRIACPPF